MIAVYLGASWSRMPLWTQLAARLGKDRALKLCMLWAAVALARLPFCSRRDMSTRLGSLLVLAGLGNGGWAVLPDRDHRRHHRPRRARDRPPSRGGLLRALDSRDEARDRAGVGAWSGSGCSCAATSRTQPQTPEAILGIRMLYGPIPATLLLAALLVLFYRFPLTRERHAEVQAGPRGASSRTTPSDLATAGPPG